MTCEKQLPLSHVVQRSIQFMLSQGFIWGGGAFAPPPPEQTFAPEIYLKL